MAFRRARPLPPLLLFDLVADPPAGPRADAPAPLPAEPVLITDRVEGIVANPSLAPDPTPEPKPGQMPLPAPDADLDAAHPAIVAAIRHVLTTRDCSPRRWEMRRRGGQSFRDLRAGIIAEMYDRTAAQSIGPGYLISGCRSQPTLVIRRRDEAGELTFAWDAQIGEIARHARRMMRIPHRDPDPDPKAKVWAVFSKEGPILYAADAATLADAAELLEPGHVGDTRLKFKQVTIRDVPEWIEIRRLPSSIITKEE